MGINILSQKVKQLKEEVNYTPQSSAEISMNGDVPPLSPTCLYDVCRSRVIPSIFIWNLLLALLFQCVRIPAGPVEITVHLYAYNNSETEQNCLKFGNQNQYYKFQSKVQIHCM